MESAAPNMIGPNATIVTIAALVLAITVASSATVEASYATAEASFATVTASNTTTEVSYATTEVSYATAAASNTTEKSSNATASDLAKDIKFTAAVVSLSSGLILNVFALYVLNQTQSRSNQKHGFLLRCMIINDIIALIGMLGLTIAYRDDNNRKKIFYCWVIVFMRLFGLGSGCVATIMAIERWLALTKPFFYQKHISLRLLKRSLISLLLIALCLVCAPYFGFGVYWIAEESKCMKYRFATKTLDVIYAYLFLCFGLALCLTIITMNLFVIKALRMKNGIYNKQNMLMRRVSRGSSLTCNAATKEERAFGQLMLIVSICFVVFWIPQLVTVPLTLHTSLLPDPSVIGSAGDLLLSAHFIVDPCAYVLHHWTLIKSVLRQKMATRANGGGSTSVSRSSSMRTCTYEVYSQQP